MRWVIKYILIVLIIPLVLMAYPRLSSSQAAPKSPPQDIGVITFPYMGMFSMALGVSCGYCHNGNNPSQRMMGGHPTCHRPEGFTAGSPAIEMTKKMWNMYMRGDFIKNDGSQFVCKDCHKGKAKFLPDPDNSTFSTEKSVELVKLMKEYEVSLGVKCKYCHKIPDFSFKKNTPREELICKKMKKMDEFMDAYEVEDEKGDVSPLTCKYCHSGKARFLEAIK